MSVIKGSWFSFLSLFTSFGTLICCALPATLVALGSGASLAALIGYFPQLVWFSEYKEFTFGVAGGLVAIGMLHLWLTRNLPCPVDVKLAAACRAGRKLSLYLLGLSAVLILIGAGFAFFPELILG